MNTVKSFWIGWGSLIVAGAGAYYFAKQDINAERREKHLARQQREYNQNMLQYGNPEGNMSRMNSAASGETMSDSVPTRNTPETTEQPIHEKSKYEATQVYRSPRGDRFS